MEKKVLFVWFDLKHNFIALGIQLLSQANVVKNNIFQDSRQSKNRFVLLVSVKVLEKWGSVWHPTESFSRRS